MSTETRTHCSEWSDAEIMELRLTGKTPSKYIEQRGHWTCIDRLRQGSCNLCRFCCIQFIGREEND